MARLLTAEEVARLVDWPLVMEGLKWGLQAEAEGRVWLPPRLTAESPTGWIRFMPGVIADGAAGGVMGAKVMNLVRGLGTRYLILLFRLEDGELLAVMDAAQVTQMRTAATTALAALHLVEEPVSRLGLLGSGFEARGHLEAMARVFPLEEVWVYSPRRERREAFAQEMGSRLGIACRAADSAEEVVRSCRVVVLATKSAEPVLSEKWVQAGATLLSIGSTRPDLRELDRETLARAAWVVVDRPEQVMAESGDIQDALRSGVLREERMVPLWEVVVRGRRLRGRPEDVLVLKTAGTAVQDLSTAVWVWREAVRRGMGTELDGLAVLKAFS